MDDLTEARERWRDASRKLDEGAEALLSGAAGYGEPHAASGMVAVLVSNADRASREYSERLREQAERSTLAHTRAVTWLSVVITIATVVQAYAALVK